MARFGRSKAKAKMQQPQVQLRVSIPLPKEERKEPKPLSPKNEWIESVQALKHEFNEKGDEENNQRKKDLTISVEHLNRSPKPEIIQPPSTRREQPKRSPKAVRSPANSAPSSPKTIRSTPKQTVEPTRSPKSKQLLDGNSSPRLSTKAEPKSPRSPKSPKSPRTPQGEEYSTVDGRRKDVLLSKSAKSKSSKKYSSTLKGNTEKKPVAKIENKPSKKTMLKPEHKSPKPIIESRIEVEERQEHDTSRSVQEIVAREPATKREAVLTALAITPSRPSIPNVAAIEPEKPTLEPEVQQVVGPSAPKVKKQGWFGFRKGKSKDPSKLQQQSGKEKQAAAEIPVFESKPPRSPQNKKLQSPLASEPSSPTSQSEHPCQTSPLQLQLWLGAVKATIVRVESDHARKSPRPTTPIAARSIASPVGTPLAAIAEEEQQPAASNYYLNAQEYGVYVDYSTFDDGDSVSSIDLLFKWLTCRDLGDGTRKRTKSEINPEGMVVSGSVVIDSDVSFDAEAQPRRRVLFSP